MLKITPLEAARIPNLVAELCQDDRAELDAAGVVDVESMLVQALPLCSWAEEAVWDGRSVALFGVRPLEDAGVPWMLTTAHMGRAEAHAIANAARRAVRRMRAEFPRLVNMVHRRNARAIRFVEALQFKVSRTPCGPGGEFFLFQWERACAIR